MKYDRINNHVCFVPAYQLACPSCKEETEVVDSIKGNLFADATHIYCPVCGYEIDMGRRKVA